VRFWREERQKRELRSVFSRYVSPEVVKRITRTAGDLMAGDETLCHFRREGVKVVMRAASPLIRLFPFHVTIPAFLLVILDLFGLV
jgi:hypothetical protein